MSGRNGFALLLVSAGALAVMPFQLSNGHERGLAVVGAYAIAILGLGRLLSLSARFSLGQGAFMALGGYTTAILCARHGVGELVTIPAAAGVAGAAGVVAGLVALRLGSLSSGIVTLGLALVLPQAALRFGGFTGGGAGLVLPGGSFEARHAYAVTWIAAGLLFLPAWWLDGSRFGRGLRAVRDNPLAAVAGGLNRRAYSVAAAGLSAAYGGVAGSLLVADRGRVDPGLFPVRLSLLLLAAAAVCGLGSIWGAFAGALLVGYLTDLTGVLPHIGRHRPGPTTFLFGVAIIALVVARGLAAAVAEHGRAKRAAP